MKIYKELKKYFNENDKIHSLMRLLSFIITIAAIILTYIMVSMYYITNKYSPNLIELNIWMYAIGMGSKATQKFVENKFKKLEK